MEKMIKKLEEEIKNLHYNPAISKHSFSDSATKEFYNCFWDIHVKPVIEYSKQMAVKYNADLEVVWLGALLHDIARLDDSEPHDEIGSKMAYDLLVKKGFDKDIADKVRNTILKHRYKNYLPETLEEKIVASADALAHFLPPFYIWIGKYSSKKFRDLMEHDLKKIERDYKDKIFFDDERKIVEEQYNVLKKWFNYKI